MNEEVIQVAVVSGYSELAVLLFICKIWLLHITIVRQGRILTHVERFVLRRYGMSSEPQRTQVNLLALHITRPLAT